ncbi:MAG: DUF4435 domain-containing protein [Ktedonobacteraceae bacterium]|nr:DUF4435 domain-containing protein [Ktedonobacteraceae bacterium]
MREYLTGAIVANAIRLARTQYSGSFLIVEGDADARLYKKFVDNSQCRVIVALNKGNAVEALFLLEEGAFSGVLAIVDADFDVLEEKVSSSRNLLFTDTHDLETMMLKSPALDYVLDEFGSQGKMMAFVEKHGRSVRSALLECGLPVGYLRWASLRHNLFLAFEGLDFEKFVDRAKLTVDISQLIKTVKDKSQKQAIAEIDLHNKMEWLKSASHDPYHVCCGHDLVCILSLSLCKTVGSHNTKAVEPEILEKLLRLAYERSFFSKTDLYAFILQWEETNPPFVVLSKE